MDAFTPFPEQLRMKQCCKKMPEIWKRPIAIKLVYFKATQKIHVAGRRRNSSICS